MKHLSKLMLAFALAATCSLGAFAQENGNRDAQNRIVRGPYETNRFFDNIFLGAAGGVNIYQGENDSYGSASERMAAALDIYVGKWLTPSVGLRLGYSGLNAKGWGTAGAPYLKNYIGEGIYREKFGISYLHADVLWNLSNAISGYKETRIWNIIPTVGFGWARTYGNDTHRNELAAHVGILNTFRLGEVVDLTLEGRQMFVNQRLDGVARGSSFEGMTSVTVGLSFKLNRRGFKRVQAPDYSAYVDRIAALERDKIALDKANVRLADQNAALRNRKPEVVTTVVENTTPAPVALFFGLGKATLDKQQLVNLDFYVQNSMKADKNKTFTLIGSADKATGSAAVNQRLSEQRIQYVYDMLVKKYGVPAERLVKKAEGDTNNLFSDPKLNRTVIIE
ncbi:OmpA family protein [Alistipes sp.]|uniref:OmpA family protein n=1 Tax=Alistipes sp. TaxID=1872444 RepID=UPI0025C3C790|nr:OmpA family protein [Alistipes sp.]